MDSGVTNARAGTGACPPGSQWMMSDYLWAVSRSTLRPRSIRATMRQAAALVCLGVLAASCASPGSVRPRSPSTAPASPPSVSAIRSQRFLRTVELDNGQLTVSPAPNRQSAAVGFSTATTLVRSDLAAAGMSLDGGLGFGDVTIASRLTGSSLPAVHDSPAWIGFLTGGATACPAQVPGTTAAKGNPPPTPGYTAIVILGRGRTVLAYKSRTSICSEVPTGPTVSEQPQVLSVPWTLVSLAGTRITYRYRSPSCQGAPTPLPRVSGNVTTGAAVLDVQLDVPYADSGCSFRWRTATVLAGPGATSGSQPPGLPRVTKLEHGPTGPVDLLVAGASYHG